MLVESVGEIVPLAIAGRVSRVSGRTISVLDFPVPIASWAEIDIGNHTIPAEVIGFRDSETLLQPYGDPTGISRGQRVRLRKSVPTVSVGEALRGRALDALGEPLDGRPQPVCRAHRKLHPKPIGPMDRDPVSQPLATGVRVIDSLLTCGRGQRLGLFAGSGVGKSTLMGQLARQGSADVNVIVLVGERGREVREFLERDLGDDGIAKSVVIVATSDDPAPTRMRAAYLGTTVAEYFRDAGNDVLLMMDSVTRFALAAREMALGAGEPPATRGFPPSVFARIPQLLERAGRAKAGSITAFYTVLVEGDDFDEPISDTVRGTLDGHVILDRAFAERHHWPAINPLASLSRCMPQLIDEDHASAAAKLRAVLSARERAEDLIDLGAYQHGSNVRIDAAIRYEDRIRRFLTQSTGEAADFARSRSELLVLANLLEPPSGLEHVADTAGDA